MTVYDIYTRVSTEDQGTSQRVSLPDQLLRCEALLKTLDFEQGEVHAEELSGGDRNRPSALRVMDRIRQKAIQGVVFLNMQRWARDDVFGEGTYEEVTARGAKMLSVDEGDLSRMSKLERVIKWNMASGENDGKSLKGRQTRQMKADKGIRPSNYTDTPLGYICHAAVMQGSKPIKDGYIEVHPVYGPLMTKSFEMVRDGVTCAQIARFWDAEFARYWDTENPPKKNSNPVTKGTVKGRLASAFYVGRFKKQAAALDEPYHILKNEFAGDKRKQRQRDSELYPKDPNSTSTGVLAGTKPTDQWPALVSEELWHDVQLALASRARPKENSNPYIQRGLLYCGHCRKLAQWNSDKNGRSLNICDCAERFSVRAVAVDLAIKQFLRGIALSPEMAEQVGKQLRKVTRADHEAEEATRRKLEQAVRNIEQARFNLMAEAMKPDTVYTRDDVKALTSKYDIDLKAAQASLDAWHPNRTLEQAEDAVEALARLPEALANDSRLKTEVMKIIDHIYIHRTPEYATAKRVEWKSEQKMVSPRMPEGHAPLPQRPAGTYGPANVQAFLRAKGLRIEYQPKTEGFYNLTLGGFFTEHLFSDPDSLWSRPISGMLSTDPVYNGLADVVQRITRDRASPIEPS